MRYTWMCYICDVLHLNRLIQSMMCSTCDEHFTQINATIFMLPCGMSKFCVMSTTAMIRYLNMCHGVLCCTKQSHILSTHTYVHHTQMEHNH